MYQRIWVPPVPPRRQHFCRVPCGLSSPSSPTTFTLRVYPRPPTELAPDQRSALGSPSKRSYPICQTVVQASSSSSHLPGFPGLPRDIRPKCPPAQSCPFAATGFPSLLSSARDVLTPSTVCSTSILGRLFRIDRHVRDSTFRGWYPTHSATGSSPAAALLSLGALRLPVSPPAPTSSAPPSGLCSVRGSVAGVRVLPRTPTRAPLGCLLPSGFSSRTVKARLRSRTLSARSLGDRPREETSSNFRRVFSPRPDRLP